MGSRKVPGADVELRVHGVSGTPPESMLDDPHPEQVAGDESGRVLRRSEPLDPDGAGSRPRVLEAFHWGRFTAGSPTKALWLLLLPFAVTNVARYALLTPARRRGVDSFADLVIRLLGLAFTLSFVITTAYVALDIGARQCGLGACDRKAWWLSWFAHQPFRVRFAVASLVPALAITLVWWFGRQSFQYEPPAEKREPLEGEDPFSDLMFWRGAASAPVQRAAHVGAACAVLGAMAVGTLGDPGHWMAGHGPVAVTLYLGLFGLCAVVFAVAVVVVGMNRQPAVKDIVPDRHDSVRLPSWVRTGRAWGAVVAGACVAFTVYHLGLDAPLSPRALTGLEIAANLSAVVTGLLLALLFGICARMTMDSDGRRLRHGDGSAAHPTVPRAFRPYWGGMGAWVLAALAALFASGLSTAVVFWTSKLLGQPVLAGTVTTVSTSGPVRIQLAASYWTGALLWGALTVLTAAAVLPLAAWLLRRPAPWVAAAILAAGAAFLADLVPVAVVLFGVAVWLCARAPRDGFDGRVREDYPGHSDDLRKAGAVILRQWRLTIARFRYHHALGLVATLFGILVLSAAVAAVLRLLPEPATAVRTVGVPEGRLDAVSRLVTGAFGTIGITVISAIAAGLVTLGVATWRRPAVRTTTGILWDLASFWPRVGHPLCPPPYGGRAVLGVAARASELVNALQARTVVLSGHSQGAVICVAACAVLRQQAQAAGAELENVRTGVDSESAGRTLADLRLITYGSQLQFIYARLFPGYLGFERLRWTYQTALGGRWRHLYRWTDPLGTHVLSWPATVAGGAPLPGPTVERWSLMSCPDPGACQGHEPERVAVPLVDPGAHLYWSIGPDARLRDPDMIADSAFRPRSPLRGHSGHEADPAFDVIVDELIDDRSPTPPCPPRGAGPAG
jgi:hypothetical protein